MMPSFAWLRSLEPLWWAALAAVVVLGFLGRKALRGTGRKEWAALASDEDGAAYSLSYVLTFPLYLILVCLIIEAALAVTVKLGTVYAAYAAARSYIVWLPARPANAGLVEQKAHQAAAQAMTPFASSERRHLAAFGGGSGSSGSVYAQAYQKYAGGDSVHLPSSYIQAKRAVAEAATQVSLDSAPAAWDGDVTVTVRYRMPFHVPAVGRLFGASRVGGVYVYPMQSTATLQVEGVKGKGLSTSGNPLGIRYDPGEL
jgi:hypothetical protein